jgi:RNA polymerase-associated protein RTF1
VESEDDNPYPIENKYKDEEDRARYSSFLQYRLSSHRPCRLLAMSEIEREGILAERAEELNKKKLRRDIAALVQLQDESVSAAAKRQHNAPGATKEKNRKLDELKAKRKAREEKGRVRRNS